MNVLNVDEKLAVGIVYPNPTKDLLKISLPERGTFEAVIYDSSSKIVLRQRLKSQQSEIRINRLKPGIYILRIQGDKWESSHYVVKK